MNSTVSMLKIAEIKTGENRRALDETAVEALIRSIQEIGLMNAITVSADMVLVAGYHRLEAFKRMGREEIPGNIVTLDRLRLRLAEIDENLVRADLHFLEEGNQMAERKEIYLVLHPETKQGTAQAIGMHTVLGNNVMAPSAVTFAEDVAAKTGVSIRTVNQKVQIANKLTAESKQAVKELGLIEKEAIALARMTAEDQKAAVQKRTAGEINDIRELAKPIRKQKKQDSEEEIAEAAKQIEAETFKPVPPEKLTKERIEEVIRQIKDPEIAENHVITADSNALNLEGYILTFSHGLYDYHAKGMFPIIGLSKECKNKITEALRAMETSVNSIKKTYKGVDDYEKINCTPIYLQF